MEYRMLGRTGVRVSPLAFGTYNFGGGTSEADGVRMVHAAVDAGINLFDTADSYSGGDSEIILGKALSDKRDRVVLATKVHNRTGDGPNDLGNSRLHILRACEASLRRLGTDYIDLYQVHRPSPETEIDETLGALTDLVRSGKVRYIGCSTHPAWMVMEALAVSERSGYARYVSEQPPYNLLDRRIENELIPLALRHQLAILPWAPIAQGVLASRYDTLESLPAGGPAARQHLRRASDAARDRRREGIRRSGPAAWETPGPTGAALDQGPAGRHLAGGRPAHDGAIGGTAPGARDDAD
jgi:aryl-alcohol dehydrogenase-like predicted oxidoreductase